MICTQPDLRCYFRIIGLSFLIAAVVFLIFICLRPDAISEESKDFAVPADMGSKLEVTIADGKDSYMLGTVTEVNTLASAIVSPVSFYACSLQYGANKDVRGITFTRVLDN